jgi:hypothetical protein
MTIQEKGHVPSTKKGGQKQQQTTPLPQVEVKINSFGQYRGRNAIKKSLSFGSAPKGRTFAPLFTKGIRTR